eukprot:954519-Karenia_brevis.AAC.1
MYGRQPEDLDGRRAIFELLKSRDLYAQEPQNLALYDSNLLKVAKGETVPKNAEHLLPAAVAAYIRHHKTCIQRTDEEMADL